jgi:OmcA/MtrC family decaheme c-type cytochrome
VTCHSEAGEEHQAVYDKYVDETTLALDITSVTTSGSTATMKFTITKDGQPYIDEDGLPGLDQKRFYTVTYDSATRMFDNDAGFGDIVALGNGQYQATATGVEYNIASSDGIAYGYISVEELDANTGGRVRLYADVSSSGISYGDVDKYESAANVDGCVKCHGEPYGKHGYRQAAVEDLPDFASCKVCHYDTREGGHNDWLVILDDPERYAELHAGDELTPEEQEQYAYMATVMGDTHITHAMEFPYPQSMANCITCHEGKLDMILTEEFFTVETCKTCHPVTGSEEYGTADLALNTILPASIHGSLDLDTADCTSCHADGSAMGDFADIHSGYDKMVYASEGVRYSDSIVLSVDDASVSNDVITVEFSAEELIDIAGIDVEDIVPTVMVGMYGWDSKDYIIGPHERLVDDNNDGEISRSSGDNRALEYTVGDDHPRAETVSASGGMWVVEIDMSTWGYLIDDGIVSRLEIAVMGELENADGVALAINAVSRTFDLASNDFDDDYFDPIVDIEGCNACHEALGLTFHGPDRGGSIVTCRLCHITKSDGSHLEMQSRSLDSYVHAIHSFQAFDIGDVDFTDDVHATEYDVHIEHTIPTFTAKHCEACHYEGTYEVPDQTKSLPGLLSASDSVEGRDRAIGDVPEVATGPAARACGGCHRAELINEDDASGLAAFYQHMEMGGFVIEVVDDELVIIVDAINDVMSYFD